MDENNLFVVHFDLFPLLVVLLCLTPVAWVILAIRQRLKEFRDQHALPFDELTRRPAGESLRVKLAKLDEQIDERIILMFACPMGAVVTVLLLKPHNLIAILTLFAIIAFWTLAFKDKLFKLLEKRRNHQLGFNGERYVGEELSRLIADGFEIYHDVPFEGFNMDHVLVGRQGVFVVETKARSKSVNDEGDKTYKVTFDGKALWWRSGQETGEIEQARDNAVTLSKWLTDAVGDAVGAAAILTFPGWWIERKAAGNGIAVVNPKEIAQVCQAGKAGLSDEMRRRICHQLNQRCRLPIS